MTYSSFLNTLYTTVALVKNDLIVKENVNLLGTFF